MNNLYFHGTTDLNRQAILRHGFQEGRDGRFGSGIYFAKYVDLALDYGEALLACAIETSDLLTLDYLEIPALFGEELPSDGEALEAFLEEAEGFPALKEWVLAHGYKGCEITYHPNDAELVLYDDRLIQWGMPIEVHWMPATSSDSSAKSFREVAGQRIEPIWFPVKQFDLEDEPLIHIGTLNLADKGEFSYEGHGLSVSTCPEEWERIAQLSGHWHTLSKVNHRFLDFHLLTTDQRQWITDWGFDHGYVSLQTAYEVTVYDSEEDCDRVCLFETYEEALQEVEDDLPVETQVLKATPRLLERLKCQIPLGLTFDLLTTLFVEEELLWDGVFWEDDYGYLSAPRAVIVPQQLPTWTIA